MSHASFIRISYPYEKCAPFISAWALKADTMLVYEHVGERTKKVHIHVAIKSSVTRQQLINIACKTVSLRGNGEHAGEKWDGDLRAAVYMTKGNLQPKYVKGYTFEETEKLRKEWVDDPKAREKRSGFNVIYDEFKKGLSYVSIHAEVNDIIQKDVAEFTAAVTRQRHDAFLTGEAYDLPTRKPIDSNELEFSILLRKSKAFVFTRMGNLCQSSMGIRSGLVVTYAYEHGINIPTARQWWLKYE